MASFNIVKWKVIYNIIYIAWFNKAFYPDDFIL